MKNVFHYIRKKDSSEIIVAKEAHPQEPAAANALKLICLMVRLTG